MNGNRCFSCCPHGGLCDLKPGHEGLHCVSGHCVWSDDEAITREEAMALCGFMERLWEQLWVGEEETNG